MANSKKGTKQIVATTPKQKVNAQFGSKAQLVDKILNLVSDLPSGSKAKLMQASNTKLMSHHHNTQRLVDTFGSKSKAIDAILAKRFPKGAPEGERAKLEGASPWKLMDLHRQSATAK